MFSSHSSATNSIRSSNRPPPPLEQTRILTLSSFLQQLEGIKLRNYVDEKENSRVKNLVANWESKRERRNYVYRIGFRSTRECCIIVSKARLVPTPPGACDFWYQKIAVMSFKTLKCISRRIYRNQKYLKRKKSSEKIIRAARDNCTRLHKI